MAFWFKANGIDQGTQTIWSKGSFIFAQDYCLACGNFETDDYITTVDTVTTPGLDVRIQGNLIQDYCSACTDFDTSYDTSSAVEKIRIIISDGTVLIDETVNMSTVFDGNWHSIVIISNDSVSDYCSACTDFSDDYITTVDNPITSGLQIRVQGNISQDHCSACTDFDASFDTSTLVEQVRVIISDGINLVDSTVNTTNIFDGNWHSIVIISTDSVSDYCSACTDFSDDYSAVSTPLITVYMDKVSMGTIDHSTVTGSLENANTAYIGINEELENPLKGSLAIFEYQGTNWTTTDVDSFHDSGRIRVGSQKAAFHFIGNDSSVDTLDKVY